MCGGTKNFITQYCGCENNYTWPHARLYMYKVHVYNCIGAIEVSFPTQLSYEIVYRTFRYGVFADFLSVPSSYSDRTVNS